MFENKITIKRVKKSIDDQLEEDYLEIKIWSPNGGQLKDILKINTGDALTIVKGIKEKLGSK